MKHEQVYICSDHILVGRGRAEQGRAGAGQGNTGQGSAGAGQGRAWQGRLGQGRAGQHGLPRPEHEALLPAVCNFSTVRVQRFKKKHKLREPAARPLLFIAQQGLSQLILAVVMVISHLILFGFLASEHSKALVFEGCQGLGQLTRRSLLRAHEGAFTSKPILLRDQHLGQDERDSPPQTPKGGEQDDWGSSMGTVRESDTQFEFQLFQFRQSLKNKKKVPKLRLSQPTSADLTKKLTLETPEKKKTMPVIPKPIVSQNSSKTPDSATLGVRPHLAVALPYSPYTTTAITPLT
ncbi:MAG: hypothetical protein FRX49_11828 [Trebouxia sp. A1-2]|nr:MAG: hypothetical protein FRX49_11828 [Trebouxia sp. A1-2]